MKRILLLLPLVMVLPWSFALAKSAPPDRATNAAEPTVVIPTATNEPVFVTNTVTIAGERVTYVAETGMLPVLKDDGETTAFVFYIAYTRCGITDKDARPVTFCFNGGPGSSSVWLHLGALGPRRVRMNPDGTLPPPPYRMVDNDYSLLNASDLVFIDPVATGYSRPVKDQKPDDFFGVTGDLDSVGEFIRLWTSRHDRWLSPKFLFGESYGVFRAAGLADHLRDRYGMYLNGLVLLSGVLNFQTIVNAPGNDLPYPLYLPAYTAAAHFHNKLPPDLQGDLEAALAECRQFARGEYVSALQQGESLDPAERDKVVAELSRLTGLTTNVIVDNNLRIDPGVFRKQLLHDQGLILGAYDSRLTGRDDDPAAEYPDFDPSDVAVAGPFGSVMNYYVRDELKFKDDLPYELLANVRPWNYVSRNSYPNAAEQLASTMNQNPYMKVLVCNGRCDLVCPVDTMRYAIDHMSLDPSYRTNLSYVQFDAGHMSYINLPDLKRMQKVVENFISTSSGN